MFLKDVSYAQQAAFICLKKYSKNCNIGENYYSLF